MVRGYTVCASARKGRDDGNWPTHPAGAEAALAHRGLLDLQVGEGLRLARSLSGRLLRLAHRRSSSAAGSSDIGDVLNDAGCAATAGEEVHEPQAPTLYSNAGISSAKDRKQRPGLDRMLNDAGRAEFDVVMAWTMTA
jgi:hypothetical protein